MYERATTEMNASGVFQWNERYPTKDHLADDIAAGRLYVCEKDGREVAAFVLDTDTDPPYAIFLQEDLSKQPSEFLDHFDGRAECQILKAGFTVPQNAGGSVVYLHRLCVEPNLQGAGVGAYVMDEVLLAAKALGAEALRFDVLEKNRNALGLYVKLGFERVANVVFTEGTFCCFERIL
jgi:ribosomal protein S18 acetylase RimI-like enzyme